ncbi:MAG TPA: cation:proton antiporter [Methanobacterium sp.]
MIELSLIEVTDPISLIKSVVFIIAAVLILLAAVGILRYRDDLERVMYARLHILGVADMACILSLLVLGEYILAAAYFVLVPFNAHAIANAYYYGEEKR